MSFIEESVYFGIILSLLAYGLGVLIKSKFKKAIFNPLLISIAITIAVLVVSDIDYETYNEEMHKSLKDKLFFLDKIE